MRGEHNDRREKEETWMGQRPKRGCVTEPNTHATVVNWTWRARRAGATGGTGRRYGGDGPENDEEGGRRRGRKRRVCCGEEGGGRPAIIYAAPPRPEAGRRGNPFSAVSCLAARPFPAPRPTPPAMRRRPSISRCLLGPSSFPSGSLLRPCTQERPLYQSGALYLAWTPQGRSEHPFGAAGCMRTCSIHRCF